MSAAYATLDDLRANLGTAPAAQHSPAYMAKMMHPVPESTVVDRTVFLLQKVAGKRVLEFGASGPMHDGIVKAASECFSTDLVAGPDVTPFDLDDVSLAYLPSWSQTMFVRLDVIVCGEVIEHLANPGFFLKRLKNEHSGIPVIITVPNAFATVGAKHIKSGIENVNRDHVSYYSYTTLKELLRRYGYTIKENYWYNGTPYTAEGLIVVAE